MKEEKESSYGLTVQCRTNGILNGQWRYATPAEVAEAHPKCGACGHYGVNNPPNPWNECLNPVSPYFAHEDGQIDPALDYCRRHSELTKEHDDETTHG